MKLLNLSIYSIFFTKTQSSLLPTKKICKDCKHFIADNIECRKFSDTNIITGKVTYDSARSVRENGNKCGKDAIYFEENNFKFITIPYYFLRDDNNWIKILLPSSFFSLYFYTLLNIINKNSV